MQAGRGMEERAFLVIFVYIVLGNCGNNGGAGHHGYEGESNENVVHGRGLLQAV